MPDNTGKDLKMFYSISEVAEMFDVQPTLLRYWEKHFPQIVPKRLNRKVRQYTQDEINKIRVVYNLVKVRGLKLDIVNLVKKISQSHLTQVRGLKRMTAKEYLRQA